MSCKLPEYYSGSFSFAIDAETSGKLNYIYSINTGLVKRWIFAYDIKGRFFK